MRLMKDASAAETSEAALRESAYPVLVTDMSAGSPGPHQRQTSGDSHGEGGSAGPDSAGPDSGGGTPASSAPGGAGSGAGGPGAPGAAATGPDEPGPGNAPPSGLTVAEARSPGKALNERRRTRRPRRGRPRSASKDRVILVAAAEVMAEKGINGLTIEEVAVRAGVGKTTIYRRWSSRGTLALDAFLAEFEGQQSLPDTGTFAGDLRAALGAWARAVSGTSAGAMLTGLIAEIQHDRNLARAWQDRVIAPLRAQYSIMLDRGVLRGEIPADTDAGVVLDLLFGACYYRLLQGQRRLNEQFVNQVVDVVAAGVGVR
jgi:AcrR family transcriptional regulator